MSGTLRRLLEAHHDKVDDWLTPRPEDAAGTFEWELSWRRNQLAGLRSYDPHARFPEELAIRLVGDHAGHGGLDLMLTSILRGLRRSFEDRADIGLVLTGVSEGSTVLHFRPAGSTDDRPVGDDPAVQVDSSPADAVGREYVALLSAAEGGEDVGPWASMVRGLEETVDALDSHDLDAEVAWTSPGGAVLATPFTGVGRANVRGLASTQPRNKETVVGGRVVELRETGWVKLKRGRNRNAPVSEVHIDARELLAMRLALGDQAYFVVTEQVQIDRLGRESQRQLIFEKSVTAGVAAELGLEEVDSD